MRILQIITSVGLLCHSRITRDKLPCYFSWASENETHSMENIRTPHVPELSWDVIEKLQAVKQNSFPVKMGKLYLGSPLQRYALSRISPIVSKPNFPTAFNQTWVERAGHFSTLIQAQQWNDWMEMCINKLSDKAWINPQKKYPERTKSQTGLIRFCVCDSTWLYGLIWAAVHWGEKESLKTGNQPPPNGGCC